ncbi:MAG: peptide/nickel transport system permease protein [Acetobacteraceae bacterium]|jgi:peptide/nickel transport system permease protein|nr:peptide/nickel transport system permease protein [Acetobacteraceae bacterium]
MPEIVADNALSAPLPRRVSTLPWGRIWRGIRLSLNPVYIAAAFLTVLVGAAILAPWIAPFDPLQGDVLSNLAPPGLDDSAGPPHLLGTDMLGRDVLSGIIFGARISLIVGLSSVIGAGLIGSALGILCGYFRGMLDEVLMRLVDVQLAFPFILLAIFIMYVLGQGLGNVVTVLVIASWPIYARIARAEAMRLREAEFVEAARALGAGHTRILLRHIAPNATQPLIVIATSAVPQMIIFEAALSFLGIGLPPSEISWGSLLAAGRDYLEQAWWIATFPGLAIMATVLSVNVLGNRLKQRLDPRSRHL